MPSSDRISDEALGVLKALARIYVWWETPEKAIRSPRDVVAQVMNIGDWEDVGRLVAALDPETLRATLTNATVGQFNARSWSYWHYRLGLTPPAHRPPPLPTRRIR